jgi:hypothetical protein
MSDKNDVPVSALKPTVFSSAPIYEIVVDPDRASLGESFVIDMRNLGKPKSQSAQDITPTSDRQVIAERLMAAAKNKVDLNTAPKVGSAIPTINDINHAHPANPVPSSDVGPPTVKVFFDMTGLGSIAIKYHKVITLPKHVIFITDTRFGGPGEFYPYCNMRTSEEKKPVGMYVQGENKLILLDPGVPNFPIKFDCEPFEFCIVPVDVSKNLNSAMIKELGIVNSEEESQHGKESGDTGGDYPRDSEHGQPAPDGDYESVEGGRGGVL